MYYIVRLPGHELKLRPLGHRPGFALQLTLFELLKAVFDRRRLIRWHRDQLGDDRCILDDAVVHLALIDTPTPSQQLPVDMFAQCQQFWQNRQAPDDPVRVTKFTEHKRVKADLPLEELLSKENGRELIIAELARLQAGIRAHREASPRTWRHDRELYYLLPEKLKAVTRLPSFNSFLGENPGAAYGCPQFIASHGSCASSGGCDLHRWGPCGKVARTVELVWE